MLNLLAQAGAASGGSEPQYVLPKIFERIDTLAHPEKLVDTLAETTWVVGAIFLTVGLLCILQGYKLYKGVVILTALAMGIVLGYKLGQHIQAQTIVAGCLGVLLAVAAWPFMKFAVSLCGGLAGAFIGANAWSGIATHLNATSPSINIPPDAYWAGALIGLVLFGMLSFILFELSVVLFTSVSGSVLAVLGIIALLLQVTAWREAIGNALKANPLVMPVLIVVPAVVGLVLQYQFGGLQRQSQPD
jgi:hypothetical protein